jgi:hypothetical protein
MVSVLAACVLISCKGYKKNSTHQEVSDESIKAGKELAAMYCQSCHLLPDPSLLDARSWEKGVLPYMGPMQGIFYHGFQQYPSYKRDPNLGAGFYPSEPRLNEIQWQSIIDYYSALSPDSLMAGKNDIPIQNGYSLFNAEFPLSGRNNPRVCFIKVDTIMQSPSLMICDANIKSFLRYNSSLHLIDSVANVNSVVDMEFQKTNVLACNMGIMGPNNGTHGTINQMVINEIGKMKYNSFPKFDSLMRPVQFTACDLTADGKDDYLICEYGNLRGALSWMENLGNNKFIKHIIREVPGSIKAWVRDINNDGLKDIYVLFAQGDEGIFLFTNLGNGKFDEKRLLRFPPTSGSTYFELVDFNKDGHPDILYTCGDNADYSAVLKPYHGVYIYMNDGKNKFDKKYFFHMNGCFKAMARDFDTDGDLDIAAISFFADYKNRPEEGFVYFENGGEFSFKPYNIPDTKKGRWLTMDTGDLDGDGKLDIFLGNFTAPEMIKSSVKFEEGPAFMVLRNTGNK